VWSGTPTWYAVKDAYVSADIAVPGTGTRTNFAHNIGKQFDVEVHLDLICIASDAGWSVGEIYPSPLSHYAPGSYVSGTPPVGSDSRLSASVVTGSGSGRFLINNKSTGVLTQITPTSWKMRLTAKRRRW
jgi:hypothetical protein